MAQKTEKMINEKFQTTPFEAQLEREADLFEL